MKLTRIKDWKKRDGMQSVAKYTCDLGVVSQKFYSIPSASTSWVLERPDGSKVEAETLSDLREAIKEDNDIQTIRIHQAV